MTISQEKFTNIFIIAALALITTILLLQALDINFSFNIGIKSSLDDVKKSLNQLTDSVNQLNVNLTNTADVFGSDFLTADTTNFSDASECNLEGLTDEEINNLTDEELNVLCPELAK